ncbi:MAG: right-handed parallel beta-helix repeat-containing protein [Mycobacterium sp.]
MVAIPAAATAAAAGPAPAVEQPAPAPAPAIATAAPQSAHPVGRPADSIRDWLAGLPTNRFSGFTTGALFLLRRDWSEAEPGAAAASITSLPGQNVFAVSTLSDSGAGSLRQAILDANAAPGADLIRFDVAGVIRVGSSSLPAVTDTVKIDGTTAPRFLDSPIVRIDFQNTDGLRLAAGASNSEILSLSLVDAAGAGVTIAASDTTLTGNYVGVWGDGRTVEGNRGDGILLAPGATGNKIGTGEDGPFVLSNVISGNYGNGITISAAGYNVVQANYIGTDSTGQRRLANRGNGIQITDAAFGNLIGGDATNNNSPTQGTFARPPLGNLISGNRGDGVLIDAKATDNTLSGNYIGTTASGTSPLGNRGDGVAIVGADFNRLAGTTATQEPFVFFNVLAGNRGNGLRISDSNDTIVWANFFGAGSDNATAVPNRGDGVLVEGSSARTLVGGEIPLGNVMAGNGRYGIEVTDTASGFLSFNSFVGQTAFGPTPVPNHAGGIRITSSNPAFDIQDSLTWNVIRTSLIGGNWGNGIEFLEDAHGAEVKDTAVGTNYKINSALPNRGNGIVIGGNASKIAIGGFNPSIQQFDSNFSVHVGSNGGYGIVLQGGAHDSTVFDTRVGLGIGVPIGNAWQLPNQRGGILIRGTSRITIGGPPETDEGRRLADEIAANRGNGVTAMFAQELQILGSVIADNARSGIVLVGGSGTEIGRPLIGNIIRNNGWYGLSATGRMDGSVAQSSTISDNGSSGVRLSGARGITIGGNGLALVNDISRNQGWGILATGWSRGSTLATNISNDNTRGDVNTALAFGLDT